MKREVFGAMGTSVDVTAPTTASIAGTRQLFETVEDVCSRFLPRSELSRINSSPHGHVSLSPLMARALHAADRARILTGGLVDVGVGDVVVTLGYDRTFAEVVDRDALDAAEPRAQCGWSIAGSDLSREIGTRIDLGGIAKGWTCDLAVEGGMASIVSAGGDIRSAASDARVEIIDPWGDVASTVHVGVGALATSSVSRRRWRVGERDVSHLIDPRTMRSTHSPVLQASATTATALEAEAAAKAILLLGTDGLAWADRQPWIRGALVVWHDGNVYATTGMEVAA